jgi:GcrA cell cycle regulator
MAWTDERIAKLKQGWEGGMTATQIAELLGEGVTRNAVIGKAHRLGLESRPSPVKATDATPAPARAAAAAPPPPPAAAAPAPAPAPVAASAPAMTPAEAPAARPVRPAYGTLDLRRAAFEALDHGDLLEFLGVTLRADDGLAASSFGFAGRSARGSCAARCARD